MNAGPLKGGICPSKSNLNDWEVENVASLLRNLRGSMALNHIQIELFGSMRKMVETLSQEPVYRTGYRIGS